MKTKGSFMTVFFYRVILTLLMVVVFCSCGTISKSVFNERYDSSILQNVEIAPLDQALTFARVQARKERHIIVVTKFLNGKIEGVNLTRAMGSHVDDPVTAYIELGYNGLVQLIKDSQSEYSLKVSADQLIIPVDLLAKHIAVGTNYPAHAGETGVENGPFLFPKHVTPTGSYENVAVQDGLLDYEVELAAVTLGPINGGKLPNEFGLILTNDFTNRAALLRNVDVNDVTSGKGFTKGKSYPGFLPVGNLFVIPRNPGEFAQGLILKLFVNDNLRQRATTDLMIWNFEKIVSEAWAKKDVEWAYKGESITLIGEESVIEARTLIMSGTPHGVIFQGIPLKTKLSGIFSWITGGWNKSVPQNVIEDYIREAEDSGLYLQPEGIVSIHVETLGTLKNIIIDSQL